MLLQFFGMGSVGGFKMVFKLVVTPVDKDQCKEILEFQS